jgi:hypothetical protein
MSDLLERLFNYDRATAAYDMIEAAKRIEALEAALREIADKRKMDAVAAVSMQAIARAALAPERNKCVHSWSAPFDGVVKCKKCGAALTEE